MLKNLTIENYALISRLEIDFKKGFSVVTGETGAGKSIIIGALSLLVGQRADSKSIKQGEKRCIVEGIFDISSYNLSAFFSDRDLEFDNSECIVRREIGESGKSRAFINDTPVNLTDLKELGTYLIDIHSQHQNLLLGSTNFQLQVVDALAGNKQLKDNFKHLYQSYLNTKKQLKILREKADNQTAEQDYIRFQYGQLHEAQLENEGEQTVLEEELETLSHVDEIKRGLFQIEYLLDNDKGILLSLKESLQVSSSLKKVYPLSGKIYERIETVYLDLKDLGLDIDKQNEALDLNPERLQNIRERLNLIYTLEKKHKVNTVRELIKIRDHLSQRLEEIDNYGEELLKLEEQLTTIRNEVMLSAKQLSETRKSAVCFLDQELSRKAHLLGMPAMQFSCWYQGKEFPDSNGLDEINFLFTANKNVPLKPVIEIASGGEISRLMLGIKALIAGKSALPTIIFDEIDTGVSGEMADKMGTLLKEMGKVMQVIAITHLPQIAAKGAYQYFVYKKDNNDQTETHMRLLSTEERIQEIAQMLSGAIRTNAAIENAKELLNVKNKK